MGDETLYACVFQYFYDTGSGYMFVITKEYAQAKFTKNKLDTHVYYMFAN